MKKKPKQLPKYDIVETIRVIHNPEINQIKKAREEIIIISKKEVTNSGNN